MECITITNPKLFSYVFSTSIEALVVAFVEVLYAFVRGLRRQSLLPHLDGILHFSVALETSATQPLPQSWERVKITSGQVWTTCWKLEC